MEWMCKVGRPKSTNQMHQKAFLQIKMCIEEEEVEEGAVEVEEGEEVEGV